MTNECNVHREIAAPLDELLGAIQGIHQKELLGHDRNRPGSELLFGDHGNAGRVPRQVPQDDLLGDMVRAVTGELSALYCTSKPWR